MALSRNAIVFVLLAGLSGADAFRSKVANLLHESLDVNGTRTAGIPFPKIYTKIFEVVRFLGAGSFGEAWLVKDKQPKSPREGQLIVMKLLYITEGRRSKHLTWDMASSNRLLRKEVIGAAKECEISKMMHEEAERSDHPGAMRIMNCYGHNAPVLSSGAIKQVKGPAARRPLYLLLENCGNTDLTKFMQHKAHQREIHLDLVKNLYKQLMQGLSFLRQLPKPWVHHDLKPDNIVVKTQTDGTYSLHLIDFGASSETTKAKRSKMTPSTGIFAPYEWGIGGNFGWCPGPHNSTPDGNCGTAFDIFSAGAIFVQLVTGGYMAYLPGCRAKNDLNHKHVERYTRDTDGFVRGMLTTALSTYQATIEELASSANIDFVPVVATQLKVDPATRPTADQILADPFLEGVSVPDDVDYVAIKRKKQRDQQSAEAEAMMVADGAELVWRKGRFEVKDKVWVFSNTAGGWIEAIIGEILPGKMLLVQYEFDGQWLQKELEEDSEYLKAFVADSEDAENQLDGDNEFKPSSGHANLLNDDVEEETSAVCMSWCDECDIAINTRGSLQGKRRTYYSKWASICYVDLMRKDRPTQRVEAGAACAGPTSVHVGKKVYEARVCQDIGLLDVHPDLPNENWKNYVKK
jgi:serine/threonine protein kinase